MKISALSHTWGNPLDTREIFLETDNGRCVWSRQVTVNLEMALRGMRTSEGPRILWIDALCINQQDLREKSHDIRRMRRIYETAYEVVAWLGVAADDSDMAMDLTSQLATSFTKSK